MVIDVNMVSILVLLVCALVGVGGFNLEPRIPVIKNGMAGSYFGYSVAQHQSVSSETGTVLNNWSVLLIAISFCCSLSFFYGIFIRFELWRWPIESGPTPRSHLTALENVVFYYSHVHPTFYLILFPVAIRVDSHYHN